MARPQPVLTYDAIKLAVSAGVTAVWATVPDPVLQVGSTILGVLVFAGFTWFTQHVVTPLADPVNEDGVPLVPAGRHAKPDEG